MNFSHPNLHIFEPMPYLEFNYLVENSLGVITDSGGITEEASILNIPCITLRDSTERPETITLGTNELISDITLLSDYTRRMVAGDWKQTQPIKFWDGKSAERIIEVLAELYSKNSFRGRISLNG